MIRVVTLSFFVVLVLPSTSNNVDAFLFAQRTPNVCWNDLPCSSSRATTSQSVANERNTGQTKVCYRFHSRRKQRNTRCLVVSMSSSSPQHNEVEDTEAVASPLSWITSAIHHYAITASTKAAAYCVTACAISLLLAFSTMSTVGPAFAEDELAARYGRGKGFDTSLVDQTCLVSHCSLKAKACLADDPDCRKGLTCTAKCMGDNACITGCMARYGNRHLDDLLKCSIEDHGCIKVAILPGGADLYGQEPTPPAPTVSQFDMSSLEGTWYKVVGYNPNYDCYACQRNVFTKIPSQPSSTADMNTPSSDGKAPWLRTSNDKLKINVEFSMPRLIPEGTSAALSTTADYPSGASISRKTSNLNWLSTGALSSTNVAQPLGLNDYKTSETIVFDSPKTASDTFINNFNNIVFNAGKNNERSYARTAHSEGEMFGLKFWENWYVIGQNDPGKTEFKFIYYNGKTRQNTYDGAFVYSRTKELDIESMQKVYQIATDAGMNPDQFCKIRNGCFLDEQPSKGRDYILPAEPLRGILASTKVSQLLGVDSVAAEEGKLLKAILADQQQEQLQLPQSTSVKQVWWKEVGDYLEDPHRHFKVMESLRQTMDWPESVKESRRN